MRLCTSLLGLVSHIFRLKKVAEILLGVASGRGERGGGGKSS